jgi:hypothetical protein
MASTVVINPSASPRIFYGRWMVLVTAMALTGGPILITGTFGIFVKPLAETFGWSRGAISLGFSIAASMASLAAPVVGVLADRFGLRKVILCDAVLFGSGFLSFAFLSASIWHLPVSNRRCQSCSSRFRSCHPPLGAAQVFHHFAEVAPRPLCHHQANRSAPHPASASRRCRGQRWRSLRQVPVEFCPAA